MTDFLLQPMPVWMVKLLLAAAGGLVVWILAEVLYAVIKSMGGDE